MENTRLSRRCGFTLVEIMIVVVIIGLLMSLVIPAFQKVRRKALNATFIGDMRTFAGAAETYMLETGGYLEDSSSGAVPAGLEEYIRVAKWTDGTPLGGDWDMELDSFGIKAGFGVHAPTASKEQMEEVDEDFDDGDLSTGKFRQIAADRYYYILEDV